MRALEDMIAASVCAAATAGRPMFATRAVPQRWANKQGRIATAAALHTLADLSQMDAARAVGCGASAISVALNRRSPGFMAEYDAACRVVTARLAASGGPRALGLWPKCEKTPVKPGPRAEPKDRASERRSATSRTSLSPAVDGYVRRLLAAGWPRHDVEWLFNLPRHRLRHFRVEVTA